jgi:hypothetical protein
MGRLRVERVLSRELGKRRFFLSPPEPPPSFLMGNPSDSVYIGRTKLLSVPVCWDYKKLTNPHMAVIGITGSGKSYFVKTFLTRASLVWGTNALIIDWAGEYRQWVEQVGGRVISLGKEGINLLDLGGITPSDRIKQVLTSFSILTDMGKNQVGLRFLELALEKAYRKRGFSLSEGGRGEEPTMKDVLLELVKMEKKKLPSRKRDALEGAVYVLRKFTSPGSDHFGKKSTIKLDELTKSGLVCIDLHGLPSESMRSLAGLTILQFLKEKMRDEGWRPEKGLKLFVVADEAWKIAADERSDLIAIVREGRKYQFGLIVASQNPTDVNRAILSNVGTMVIMRLQLKEFKEYVRGSLRYSAFIEEEIDRFGVGNAAIHMIPYAGGRFPQTFLLDRIDGEEPFISLHIVGDGMDVEFERDDFKKRLVRLGLNDEQIGEVVMEFERSDYKLSVLVFISLLEKYGFAKSVIVLFLREMGVKEGSIINLFSQIKRIKMGVEADKISTLVVRDA